MINSLNVIIYLVFMYIMYSKFLNELELYKRRKTQQRISIVFQKQHKNLTIWQYSKLHISEIFLILAFLNSILIIGHYRNVRILCRQNFRILVYTSKKKYDEKICLQGFSFFSFQNDIISILAYPFGPSPLEKNKLLTADTIYSWRFPIYKDW